MRWVAPTPLAVSHRKQQEPVAYYYCCCVVVLRYLVRRKQHPGLFCSLRGGGVDVFRMSLPTSSLNFDPPLDCGSCARACLFVQAMAFDMSSLTSECYFRYCFCVYERVFVDGLMRFFVSLKGKAGMSLVAFSLFRRLFAESIGPFVSLIDAPTVVF